jgi:Transcriptional regulator
MKQKRKTESKEYIIEAFTRLLHEKSLEKITVSDISRLAGINRGTFYLNYLDKEDLLVSIINEKVNGLKNIMTENDNLSKIDILDTVPYETILDLLYYFKKDSYFISGLVKNHAEGYFITAFKNIMEDLFFERLKLTQVKFSDSQVNYLIEMINSNIISITLLWIKRDFSESEEEIAQLLEISKTTAPLDLFIDQNQLKNEY